MFDIFQTPLTPPLCADECNPNKTVTPFPTLINVILFLILPFIDFLAAFVTCINQFGANCHMDNKSIFKCQAARI